jgi:uncharacterized protein YciI
MATYSISCVDGPEGARLRVEHMKAHLAHIDTVIGDILIAGPVQDKDGGANVASLLVIQAESAAAARAWLERDPYYKAGVWKSIEIAPFKPVAGTWIGGKTW